MALNVGARIGSYEVVGSLGAGGMGEVYRALDTRLKREVALKILPDHFVGDADRLARFQREAEVLAALAHANIAHIYAIEDGPSDGGRHLRALVLELVEGPTLADRVAEGPIPVDEAVAIARQIADALDAAHEHGIVHRDLKPANIKLRGDGTVKVLDFGLAKLASSTPEASLGGATLSPTLSVAFTGAGVILGTAAYMSPEQARGKAVDKRADVWAFGCVLYEMLTGRRAFDGTDATEMIAAVVRGEPDWSALPVKTPAPVLALLRRCLQKDPRQRLRDIGDARYELDRALEPVSVPVAIAVPARRSRLRTVGLASSALLLAAAAGAGAWLLKPPPERGISRFEIMLPADQQFSFPGRHMVAVSPQGHIAYAANNRIFLRLRDQLMATPIGAGDRTNTVAPRNPFFSPDGQWLGFWEDGELKKVSITGGAAVLVTAAQNPWGVSWESDGTILYGQGADGIYRVSEDGGRSERIISVTPPESAHGPQLLPDGRTVLFTLASQSVGAWNQARIVAHSLDSGTRTEIINGGTDARYLRTGHLLYSFNGNLLAVPFDASELKLTGGVVSLVEEVAQTNAGQTGAAQFSVTPDGTLVYLPEAGTTVGVANRTLVWLDGQGREEALQAPPRAYRYVELSHDGTRVVFDATDENRDVFVLPLALGTPTPLTFEPSIEQTPVWTPDSERVIFSSTRDGASNIYWQAANGSGTMERLTNSPNAQVPQAVTPDGTQLIFLQVSPGGNDDLMVMPLTGERRPAPLIATRFRERNAALSPNGRWLAYQSDKSGVEEVWVTPFPVSPGNGEWKVSTEGGTRPRWVSDQELGYLVANEKGLGRLMRIRVTEVNGALEPRAPIQMLDDLDSLTINAALRAYDFSKDGRRVLTIKTMPSTGGAPSAPPRVVVVQNFVDEVTRRVPAR